MARSGFVNVEPTAGGFPPGRNSRAVSGNFENRAALSAVWSEKVWSTTNPRRASGLGRLEQLVEALGAQRSGGLVPQRRGARDADGQAGADRGREVVGSSVGIGEGLLGEARRSGLPPVDGPHLLGPRVEVDEETAPTDSRRVGLSDAERRCGRYGGVGGVAAAREDVDAYLAGVAVDGGNGTTRAHHDRDLGQIARPIGVGRRVAGQDVFSGCCGCRRGHTDRDDKRSDTKQA